MLRCIVHALDYKSSKIEAFDGQRLVLHRHTRTCVSFRGLGVPSARLLEYSHNMASTARVLPSGMATIRVEQNVLDDFSTLPTKQ